MSARAPDRWSKDRLAQLDAQIVEVLREDHPQSVRHVYYRMTDPRQPVFVQKDDLGYDRVQRQCLKLRRDGAVPYAWVVDSGRFGYHQDTFTSVGDFLISMRFNYRVDPWACAACRVEVWVESRSLAGVLEGLCEELCVSLSPTAGFSSATFVEASARRIVEALDGRRLVVLYVGDYDPAGVLIDEALEREMRRHLDADFEFRRLGITPEQIARYSLPGKPRKKGEKRAQHVLETVEAEAMPSHVMRDLVRKAVLGYLPRGAMAKAEVATNVGQTALSNLAREHLDE